jgi:polyhydroxybutyrate depolymerase
VGGRAGARRGAVLAVFAAVALLAGSCSSPGATRSSTATATAGGATGPNTGAPLPSPGCAGPATAAVAVAGQRQDVTVDGVDRWYLLTTPTTRPGAGPLPLVVDVHGLGEGASIEADTTQFGAKAQADGFIAVFPEGTGSPVSWDIEPSTAAHPNHDLDFMRAMLTSLEAERCVDESRVYATGLSDGALFTSLLACTMAGRFAAFAPVAGVALSTPCDPGRRVPIIAFHGTADPILYFNGGVNTTLLKNLFSGKPLPTTPLPPVNLNGKGYPANVKAWAAKDGCNTRETDTMVSAHVIRRTYRCPADVAVVFYIVLGGGHAWPGSTLSAATKAFTGPSTFEIDATDLIWTFFRHFRIGH